MNPHKGRGSQGDESHLHIDIDLVDVQPSAGVLPLAPHSLFKHTHTHTHSHTNTLEKKTIYQQEASLLSLDLSPLQSCFVHVVLCCCCFSRTSPPAAREGWGCRAQTSGACVSPPGLGAGPSPSPPGTGPSCPRQQTPVGPHKQRLSSAHTRLRALHSSWAKKKTFSHKMNPVLLKFPQRLCT